MIKEISQRSLDKAARLGRKAAKEDGWLDVDFNTVAMRHGLCRDFGDYVAEHRATWEETHHFQIRYEHELNYLARKQGLRLGCCKRLSGDYYSDALTVIDWDKWNYECYQPILEAFWDAWEETVGLYEKWKAEHHD